MNKVILLGNLTRDPEIRYSQNDNSLAIARFSMAISRRRTRQGEDETDFFNCTAFGKQAEFVEKYFKKGSRMMLTGRIQNDNYTNKNNEKVYSVQIIAEEIEFAERRNSADANNGGGNAGFTPSAPNPANANNDEFSNLPDGIDEDLPFN